MKNGKDVDQILSSLQDICIFCLLASLLFFGTFVYNPTGDPVLYQCYAVGFWHGFVGISQAGTIKAMRIYDESRPGSDSHLTAWATPPYHGSISYSAVFDDP